MLDFCRRLGIAVNAGIPLLNALRREAERSRSPKMFADVVESLENGSTFAEALRRHPKHFDEMFITLVEVGEQSGMLAETLNELADYYEQRKRIRQDFLKALMLPAIELVAAIVVIGAFILLCGLLEVDPLGWGITGVTGLLKYLTFLALVAGGGVGLYIFVTKNAARSRYVHYLSARIPQIGKLFKKMALVRLTWALGMTTRTGMDMLRALTLSFQTTSYAPISDQLRPVLETLRNGGTLTDAFVSAVGFEHEFLTSVDTGEQSGEFPEMMLRLSKMYNGEAMLQLRIVSMVGAWGVYGLVALLIIAMIFKLAFIYIGTIQGALEF